MQEIDKWVNKFKNKEKGVFDDLINSKSSSVDV